MIGDEALRFALVQLIEFLAIEGGHGFASRNDSGNTVNRQGAES
jgi:hypothetical protein